MSMETRLIALAQALGADIKLVNTAIALGVTERGDLSTLTTTAKTSLVAALNEVNAAITALSAGAAGIDDAATDGDTTSTWSANKIFDELVAAKQAVKNEILDGAGAALDTLNELATALGNDANFAASIAAELTNRVRVDQAQAFTELQKTQGRDNIGAAAASDLSTLTTAIGDTDHDFVADYNTAKA